MKLYVLVREDLNPTYQAVQSGHAVAQYMLEHGYWKNETLVYLSVKNEQQLEKWKYKLDKISAKYSKVFKDKGYDYAEDMVKSVNNSNAAAVTASLEKLTGVNYRRKFKQTSPIISEELKRICSTISLYCLYFFGFSSYFQSAFRYISSCEILRTLLATVTLWSKKSNNT